MKYKHFNRLLSMLLVVATLFGLMALPANAASLSDSGTVTIQQAGYGNYLSRTTGGTIGGGYWKYTSNDGLTGTAYCVNHGLKGVSPSKALTVQEYNRNPQTMGVFASGYPNRTLEQFKELHQDDVRGVNALTEDEYKYATQAAVWASCGQLAVPGTSFTAGRETLAVPTADAQKIRIFDSVKAMLNLSQHWTKNLYTGMSIRAEENQDVRGVEIVNEYGLEGAAASGEDGIKKETINGKQYYTRVMYVASATSTWIDERKTKVYSTDAPQGTIRELEAAQGYELDKEYKTVYVQPGKTIEIEWENVPITGQFQVYKYAAEYNEVTGTAAGAPLKGAVYEISEARSGKVVDYITTDARGVAASKPLPLGRYKIVEVTAPPYWKLSGTVFDETLEYSGQIIKVSDYDKPSNLGVTITKRGNAQVLAGSQMRYDITVANTSNVALENFYWHDRIPTDATRATVLTTGTYSARLNYRVLYKTNYTTAYQVLASNLLTTSSYSFSLNAIPMQAGEYVTDVYFDFGKVPVGFQSTANPTLTVQVLGTVANNYQINNRADVGGKYQGTWETAQATWLTIVRRLTNPVVPTLPKTGY